MCGFIIIIALLLPSVAAAQNTLHIDGTGDSQELLRQLSRSFSRSNPDLQIIIPDSIGSSGGVRALIEDRTDMARTARKLTHKELLRAPNLVYHEIALSPVVFVANLPDRCVENITTDQVIGIFSGAINDWGEFGTCSPHKMYIANREVGDSSRNIITNALPELQKIATWTGMEIYSTPETATIITQHPYTFGYLPAAMVDPSLTTFSIDGVTASEENITSGTYPLVSTFALVTKGAPTHDAQRFINYIASDEGKIVLQSMQVVPAQKQDVSHK